MFASFTIVLLPLIFSFFIVSAATFIIAQISISYVVLALYERFMILLSEE